MLRDVISGQKSAELRVVSAKIPDFIAIAESAAIYFWHPSSRNSALGPRQTGKLKTF
jgi:hypothetical protein